MGSSWSLRAAWTVWVLGLLGSVWARWLGRTVRVLSLGGSEGVLSLLRSVWVRWLGRTIWVLSLLRSSWSLRAAWAVRVLSFLRSVWVRWLGWAVWVLSLLRSSWSLRSTWAVRVLSFLWAVWVLSLLGSIRAGRLLNTIRWLSIRLLRLTVGLLRLTVGLLRLSIGLLGLSVSLLRLTINLLGLSIDLLGLAIDLLGLTVDLLRLSKNLLAVLVVLRLSVSNWLLLVSTGESTKRSTKKGDSAATVLVLVLESTTDEAQVHRFEESVIMDVRSLASLSSGVILYGRRSVVVRIWGVLLCIICTRSLVEGVINSADDSSVVGSLISFSCNGITAGGSGITSSGTFR